jgi:hypothetical protein
MYENKRGLEEKNNFHNYPFPTPREILIVVINDLRVFTYFHFSF